MKKIDPKLNPFRVNSNVSLKRVFDTIYDDINDIISSINVELEQQGSVNEVNATNNKTTEVNNDRKMDLSTSEAKTGDIAIFQKKYKVASKDSKIRKYDNGNVEFVKMDSKSLTILGIFTEELGWCQIKSLKSYAFDASPTSFTEDGGGNEIATSSNIKHLIHYLDPIKNIDDYKKI